VRPLDPRLLRATRAVRTHLVVTVVCGFALTGLILLQAWLLARAISRAPVLAADGSGAEVGGVVAAVGVVALARVALAYGAEVAALRSAARVKSQLRRRLVAHVAGPGADPAALDAGELVTLATRGLDALDDYVARYLPQLVLAVLVPVAVLVVVLRADWLSALIIAGTLPLIPVFMALIGWQAQDHTRRQWRLLSRLGGHFLDAVEGLPTLAIFRRAKAEAALIRRTSEAHREATVRTLRIAFLSALVLELLATLSVALVAVEIGLRLLYGRLDLETALFVLVLAPEAYLPLREVGARFHASVEGVAAAEQVFAVLDRPGRAAVGRERPGAAVGGGAPGLRFDAVRLTHPGRTVPALDGVDLVVPSGQTLVLTGPSGSGKSTLISLILRFADPDGGRIVVTGSRPPDGPGRSTGRTGTASSHGERDPSGNGTRDPVAVLAAGSTCSYDLGDLPVEVWRRGIAWVPQHPYLFDASVADNIRLGVPDADDDSVRRAAELAEAHEVIRALPDGYATRIGERGTRLSAGQRQRIALARAFLRRLDGAALVLLDEPTAHLDPDNAAAVRRGAARLLTGATAVVVAHDPGWEPLADEVVGLDAGRIVAPRYAGPGALP
jgi:ATP-binding cassette subfamily C protein CydD